ncbi:MAG: preprotein translocase subunit SecA [Candidatus Omnitrophota bacterium]
MFGFIRRIFGTQNERELRKTQPIIDRINGMEEELSSYSDDDIKKEAENMKKAILSAKEGSRDEIESIRASIAISASDTEKDKHKKRLRDIKNSGLNENMAKVFALVRESSKRTTGLRHFDVQLMGGIVLHQGKIAEMTTGEGKTLVATLPACLNAFGGESVHIVTVNDYLAKRDSEWMGPIYKFLGLSVGVIQNDMRPEERKKVYACDIVYGTNNEFGFDYLRDNMVSDKDDIVQGHPAFAIVDEVDSILIDEARTPLIISGPVDETNRSYDEMRPVVTEIVKAQNRHITECLLEAKKRIAEGKKDEAGQLLYLVHKGDPKNREFLDMVLNDMRVKDMFDKTQSLMDSKIMEKERADLLEGMFYVFDEKSREVTFYANGLNMMKERFGLDFVLEDIEAEIAELANKEMSKEEKIKQEAKLIAVYSEKQKKVESTNQLLKAYRLFEKDVDYVIKDNKIVIVDSFTGRMMPGRRFSDGIHEAIEAKEMVEVQRESQTLATITLQNYFRMYDKLAGMTGTAKTEEMEFENIYLLSVIQIPTNRPLRRMSMPDRIYKTEHEKFSAVADEVGHRNSLGGPVLVGTISIDKSEKLSRLLNSRGIRHNVLNAKYHENEAHIIAQAGQYGAVTIATNMAGRGTDIILGGNPEELSAREVEKLNIEDADERERVFNNFMSEFQDKLKETRAKIVDVGGLQIIGTERHEARRIDDQLRGRSGRQGDPGSSRFYLSLEDDLMRIFGSDRIRNIMDRLGMEEGEVIENPLVTRAIRTAQHRVESQNFEIRKHLLKYDNVMNQQREVIYKRRRMVLSGEDLKKEFFECLEVGMESLLVEWEESGDETKLARQIMYKYMININPDELRGRSASEIIENVAKAAEETYSVREKVLGEKKMKELEKMIMISVIDHNWKEYLREIDELREGISWRAYAQKDPLIEFQHEAFRMFRELVIKIDEQTAERVIKISTMEEEFRKKVFNPEQEKFEHEEYSALGKPVLRVSAKKEDIKVGRNEPCPCGSGKKYKKCCGS